MMYVFIRYILKLQKGKNIATYYVQLCMIFLCTKSQKVHETVYVHNCR
jgi:hypothetical protein